MGPEKNISYYNILTTSVPHSRKNQLTHMLCKFIDLLLVDWQYKEGTICEWVNFKTAQMMALSILKLMFDIALWEENVFKT